MNYQIIVLVIFSLTIIITPAYAQIPSENSLQKSVQVQIDSEGGIEVTHEIKKHDLPQQLDLLDGTITDLTATDENGNQVPFGIINENSIMVFPSNEIVTIRYELSDVLTLEDNLWTWNVLYLQSTSFIFPDEVDLIFVNDNPVFLSDKPGIMCHGCQMKLEYSLNQQKLMKSIKINDQEYFIEFISWAEIKQFAFDKEEGLSFDIEGDNDFVTLVIPKNFLIEPFEVSFNGEKIFFSKYIENATHTWISLRPESSGEVSIKGTIIPDFSDYNNNPIPNEYLIGIGIAIAIGVALIFIKKKK